MTSRRGCIPRCHSWTILRLTMEKSKVKTIKNSLNKFKTITTRNKTTWWRRLITTKYCHFSGKFNKSNSKINKLKMNSTNINPSISSHLEICASYPTSTMRVNRCLLKSSRSKTRYQICLPIWRMRTVTGSSKRIMMRWSSILSWRIKSQLLLIIEDTLKLSVLAAPSLLLPSLLSLSRRSKSLPTATWTVWPHRCRRLSAARSFFATSSIDR